jgi:hypothetical protein
MLVRQLNWELAPMRGHIGVAVDPHGWKLAGVVLGVHFERQPNTVQFDVNPCHFGLLLGGREGWQEHGCQQRDDGDHHQQLDERKGPGGQAPVVAG